VAITSSGTPLTYTATTSAAWLKASQTSGTTPGSVAVSVNSTGMTAGTYTGTVNITAAGASNSPQTVAVTFVVTNPASTSLTTTPASLTFSFAPSYDDDIRQPSSQTQAIQVTSSNGQALSFTAAVSGGSWLSVSPAGGTTPATVNVSVQTSRLAPGTYQGTISLSSSKAASTTVAVTLTVGSSNQGTALTAQPYVKDPAHTGTVAARWVSGAGLPVTDKADPYHQGLVISKNSPTSTNASAGAAINGVAGMTITELGFDVRQGGHCTARAPRFVIITSDDVVHSVVGCAMGTVLQPAPAVGWKRLRFDVTDPAQASPAITPGTTVKSIWVVFDEGPTASNAAAGMVVLDNIDVNGTLIGSGPQIRRDD
jgi:hypothetical protein